MPLMKPPTAAVLSHTLDAYLGAWIQSGLSDGALEPSDGGRQDVADTVAALAEAIVEIAALLSLGALAGPFGAKTGKWGGTDPQRALDVMANTIIVDALHRAPVAFLVSEEIDDPIQLSAGPQSPGRHLAVAVDPLDGASNADTNAAIGTIFSVFPARSDRAGELARGVDQRAAGFAVYGPQTVLVLTLGDGTHVFTLDPRSGRFVLTAERVAIPPETSEFAINASNHFHWEEPIRGYVETCLRGPDGQGVGGGFQTGQNMRWTGSFVAEIYRILVRGGVYLYPRDSRPGYRNGRLRLAYEACPVALIIEQAGGAASNGRERLLEVPILDWHQRSPVFAGAAREVAHVERLHSEPFPVGERSPLFGRRGLFRV